MKLIFKLSKGNIKLKKKIASFIFFWKIKKKTIQVIQGRGRIRLHF